MLNPKSVADSVCKIETELCYLHGLLAAEELGTIVKQSGEAPNQQLKQAIALLNRWMDDPDQDMLLSDTDRFVRESATACV